MAWWRRRQPAHAAPPVRRQATWAAPAFPPEVEAAVAAAVAAPPPVVPEQRTGVAVRLGFVDGSEMHLPAEDPRARALQAVADLLVKTEPVPPTTNSEPSDHGVRRIV